MLDFSDSRLPPFKHQMEDAERLVNSPFLFITSEMRTGKSKIVIDALQFLFHANIIDTVIIVAPGPVRSVWYDPALGELQKHLWLRTSAAIYEYHSEPRVWTWPKEKLPGRQLTWIVTNYEFIRSATRLKVLIPYAGPRTFIILDESSFVKTHGTKQTAAASQLRWASGRVSLLNGTPISHSPMDLYSQGNILHTKILNCNSVTLYRLTYAEMAPVIGADGKKITSDRGFEIKKIVGWKPEGLADLQRRFAPYTIRRLQKDCLDLPPKLDPVTLTAELTTKTWNHYRAMRDEMVVWLSSGVVATAAQAAVKSMRLSQITGGFLGGIEDAFKDDDGTDIPVWMRPDGEVNGNVGPPPKYQEIGSEKLDVLMWFIEHRFEQENNPRMVSWCRFRPELDRLINTVTAKFHRFSIGKIMGGQKKDEREHAMRLLHPHSAPSGPVFVGGTFGTGSFGLNFTAANISINYSFDYSLGKFLQSQDRVYGPGQASPVAYFDIVAVGPKGQRTIDHVILEARKNNENIAAWTTAAWIKALTEE